MDQEKEIQEISEIELPCVLSIQTGINEPRYVGIRGIRKELGFLLGSQLKNRTAMDYVSRADNRSIHSQAAVFDPGGKARARVLSE